MIYSPLDIHILLQLQFKPWGFGVSAEVGGRLGVLLFTMLSGCFPYRGATDKELQGDKDKDAPAVSEDKTLTEAELKVSSSIEDVGPCVFKASKLTLSPLQCNFFDDFRHLGENPYLPKF